MNYKSVSCVHVFSLMTKTSKQNVHFILCFWSGAMSGALGILMISVNYISHPDSNPGLNIITALSLRNSGHIIFFTRGRLGLENRRRPFPIHVNAAESLCNPWNTTVRRVPERIMSRQIAQCRCWAVPGRSCLHPHPHPQQQQQQHRPSLCSIHTTEGR